MQLIMRLFLPSKYFFPRSMSLLFFKRITNNLHHIRENICTIMVCHQNDKQGITKVLSYIYQTFLLPGVISSSFPIPSRTAKQTMSP